MSLFEEVKADVVADQGRGRVLTVRSLASPGLLPSSFPVKHPQINGEHVYKGQKVMRMHISNIPPFALTEYQKSTFSFH